MYGTFNRTKLKQMKEFIKKLLGIEYKEKCAIHNISSGIGMPYPVHIEGSYIKVDFKDGVYYVTQIKECEKTHHNYDINGNCKICYRRSEDYAQSVKNRSVSK